MRKQSQLQHEMSLCSVRVPPAADPETWIRMEALDLGGDNGKHQQWCYQASVHWGQVLFNPWQTMGNSVEHISQNYLSCRVGSQGVYLPTPALGGWLLPEAMRVVHSAATSGYQAK